MLGPSGCGKTTTLRCIAGLEQETSGQIFIGDELVSGLRPSQRDIAMVFQFYALYPHLTVRDNMAFPLRAAKRPESEVNERVLEAARMLQLEPYLTRKPNKLSGGEQQRVALGRAMVRHPKAFLMDEPLTNLDAELRADMRAELKHVQQRLNSTMIYVTHDQTEAMALGQPDRDPQRGQAGAGRRAAGGLRPAGDAVRGALHRLAADEPDRGRGHQRRADRRRRAEDRRARGPEPRRQGDRGRAARAARR